MNGDEIAARLRMAGCVFAEDEARLLLEELGSTGEPMLLEDAVRRRAAGEPLETVLGWAEFCGLRLAVAPGVFVPRRRTELLVRLALEHWSGSGALVDLCTGVGAVPAAFLDAVRNLDDAWPEVFAVDVDPVAIECAHRNLAGTGVSILTGDLDEPLPQRISGGVTVMTANAPYVPSGEIALMPREAREFEPAHTLDGGVDGVALHRRIAALAPRWLAPGGVLLIETSERQAPRTADAIGAAGLRTNIVHDAAFDATVVVGRRETS